MRFLALLLAFSAVKAQASINCTEYLRRQGAFQIHRFEAEDHSCFFSVDPFNVPADMRYRSFLITDSGMLMVFNSFDTGETPTSSGARVFYFFPRQIDPDMEAQSTHTVLKTTTPGIELNASLEKARILSMKGGRVQESLQVSPSNFGGVEFSGVKTLYLDAGFKMGSDPTGDAKRTSKFIDSKGKTCKIQNAEIFDYTSDGNANFKFSDSELKKFMSSRCPDLFVNF